MNDQITIEMIRSEEAREESTTQIVRVLGIAFGLAILVTPWVLCSLGMMRFFDALMCSLFSVLIATSVLTLVQMHVAYSGHPVISEFLGFVNAVLGSCALLCSPSALGGFLMLGSHYENCGRYKRCEQMISTTRKLAKFALLFPAHLRLSIKAGHMQVLYYKGDFEQSKKLALEVVRETNEAFAKEPNVNNEEALRISQPVCLRFLKEMGAGDIAEPHWKKLSEMPDFCSDSKASSLVYVYNNLGFGALAFHDYNNAVKWLEKARECHRAAQASQGILGEILANLAFAYLEIGELDKAEKTANQCLEVRKAFTKYSMPFIAEGRLVLGRVELARGKNEVAEKHLQAAAMIRKGRMGENCPAIAEAFDAYAECLSKLGKSSESKEFEVQSRQIKAFHASETIDTEALPAPEDKKENVEDLVARALKNEKQRSEALIPLAVLMGGLVAFEGFEVIIGMFHFSLLNLLILSSFAYFAGRAGFAHARIGRMKKILSNLSALAQETVDLRLFKKGPKFCPQFSGTVAKEGGPGLETIYFDIPSNFSPPLFRGERVAGDIYRERDTNKPVMFIADRTVNLISNDWFRKGSSGLRTAILLGTLAVTFGGVTAIEYVTPSRPRTPQVVPNGLTCKQYFDLGVEYKGLGWTEQARDSLNRAIKMAPDSEDGKKAKIFLDTKVPVHPVSEAAIHENIMAFNLAIFDKEGAKKAWKDCIAKYPDFEWPYGNLAATYLDEGNTAEAEKYIKKALEINPKYVNAWTYLARCKEKQNDPQGAADCRAKILELDPENADAKPKGFFGQF